MDPIIYSAEDQVQDDNQEEGSDIDPIISSPSVTSHSLSISTDYGDIEESSDEYYDVPEIFPRYREEDQNPDNRSGQRRRYNPLFRLPPAQQPVPALIDYYEALNPASPQFDPQAAERIRLRAIMEQEQDNIFGSSSSSSILPMPPGTSYQRDIPNVQHQAPSTSQQDLNSSDPLGGLADLTSVTTLSLLTGITQGLRRIRQAEIERELERERARDRGVAYNVFSRNASQTTIPSDNSSSETVTSGAIHDRGEAMQPPGSGPAGLRDEITELDFE